MEKNHSQENIGSESSKKERKIENILNDIQFLKSISERPENLHGEEWNYYVEEIKIEYFVSKEKRFISEVKYLFIELFDPKTENKISSEIHNKFKELGQPIDLIEVMNLFPQYIIKLLDYYGTSINFHEKLSIQFKNSLKYGAQNLLRALYLIEILRKKEPTLAALEILGDYIRYNLNWCIRSLNKSKIDYYLEDSTVRYLINVYISEKEERNEPIDERFSILSRMYLEKAFPN